MASARLDVISIGTLSRNRLWGETEAVRTPHATTSLIRTGKRNILIDPALPPQVIAARLVARPPPPRGTGPGLWAPPGRGPGEMDTFSPAIFAPPPPGGPSLSGAARLYTA